jgi:hypothetical protein
MPVRAFRGFTLPAMGAQPGLASALGFYPALAGMAIPALPTTLTV